MKSQSIVLGISRGYGVLLGFIGLNHLLHFFPTPAYTGQAELVYGAFQEAGYFMPIVGIIMILTATTLLLNRWVTAGLLGLLPVLANMLLFHLFLAPVGIMPALIMTSLTCFLLVRLPAFTTLMSHVVNQGYRHA